MRKLNPLILLLLVVAAFYACEDESYFNSPDATLNFSTDTVMFDTVFTSVGSITKNFRIYNPYKRPVLISNIRLAKGDQSSYRLNVDGLPFTEKNDFETSDVEIEGKDSLYIFVEVTVDPNNSNNPILESDSIIFETNGNIQNVKLLAWGQDVEVVKSGVIKSQKWTANKPYLVYGEVTVDSRETLTIEPGTKVYFHYKSGINVKGNIKVLGTVAEPVSFLPDRLEELYVDIPDLWQGIFLHSGSVENEFRNLIIRNGNVGIQVGDGELIGSTDATIQNVKIENMGFAGIFAIGSTIKAENLVLGSCGTYAAALLAGGNYEFTHTTIANYWGGFTLNPRRTPSLVISNSIYGDSIINNLEKATFENSIIYGNSFNEVQLNDDENAKFNYFFDHCLLRVSSSFDVSDEDHFKSVLTNINPMFVDPYDEHIFELDSLSPMRDTVASRIVAEKVLLDMKGVSRFEDLGPDLGALEWIPKEEDEEKVEEK